MLVASLPHFALVQAWSRDISVVLAANGVAWTLSCEMFFYALFPLIVALLLRLSPRLQWMAVAALAVVVVVALPAAAGTDYLVYYFPPSRLLEFIVGILLALRCADGWRSPVPTTLSVGLLALAFALIPLAPDRMHPVAVTFLPIALLITSAASRELDGRRSVLTHAWLVRLGVWSFALYLTHTLVIRLFAQLVPGGFTGGVSALGLAMLAVPMFAACIAVAYAAYHYIERPAETIIRGAGRSAASGAT